MKLKYIPITFLSATLVACGGGGGGGGPSTPAQANTAFVLSAKVNGVAVPNFSVSAGEGKVLGLLTGEVVELTASSPYTIVRRDFGKATPDVRAETTSNFQAAFNTVENTTATLVFGINNDPGKVASVTFTIRGTSPNFNPVTPKVGDAFTYAEADKTLAGTTPPFPDIRRVVTSLNPAGGWNEDYIDVSRNLVLTKVNLNAEGNRTGYQATANDPIGCKEARYEPAGEQLLVFPLQVGTPYQARWTASCLPSDSQTETLTASVLAYEKVTTRGGVFNALRINQVTKITNSTNKGLPNGSYEQNVTVWFDPILGRNVKYSGVRTYPGGEPADKTAFLSNTDIELINTVKN